nr:MAG TPA: hypothetical protein [Caudoviricetes sp.]
MHDVDDFYHFSALSFGARANVGGVAIAARAIVVDADVQPLGCFPVGVKHFFFLFD